MSNALTAGIAVAKLNKYLLKASVERPIIELQFKDRKKDNTNI